MHAAFRNSKFGAKTAVISCNTHASEDLNVQEGTKNLLKSSGVAVGSLEREAGVASKTVTDVSSKATPAVNKVLNFLSTSSPETLGKIGIVLVAVYYLTPFALKTAVSSFRGYAGALHAAHSPSALPSGGAHAQPQPCITCKFAAVASVGSLHMIRHERSIWHSMHALHPDFMGWVRRGLHYLIARNT